MHFEIASSPREISEHFPSLQKHQSYEKTLDILLTGGWLGIRDIWDRAVWTIISNVVGLVSCHSACVEYIPKFCILSVSGLCPSVLKHRVPYPRKMETSTVLLKKPKNSHINCFINYIKYFPNSGNLGSNSRCYTE